MGLRPDIAAAAETMVARDRVDRELGQLAACLNKGEAVQRLSSGTCAAGYGLLVITGERVIALREGSAGQVRSDFRLDRLSTVDWSPGLFAGTITFADPTGCTQIRQVNLAEGEEIVQLVRARIDAGADTRWRRLRFLRRKAAASPSVSPPSVSPPAPARSADEYDTEILVPVGGRRIGEFRSSRARTGAHRVRQHRRQGADQHRRHAVWKAAAAAGLIGLAGVGSYYLLTERTRVPYANETSELAAMNVAPVTQPPPAVARPTSAVVGVVRVIDADSFEVAGGASGRVEVIGIQAPTDGQCGAAASAAFAMSKLNGTVVTLVTDPGSPGIDEAGRLLSHVKLADGTDYAVLAARAGMVKYYEPGTPGPQAAQIKAAQAEAEQSNDGLWGTCSGGGA